MIICHSRRFVFVHVHKTGGTSIKTALDPLLQWNDLILGGTPIGEYLNEVYRQRFKLSKHASVAEIDKVCGTALCDEYYVFATVRHPVDRLCSIYNFIGGIVARSLAREGIAADSLAGPPGPELLARAPELGWPASRAYLGSADFSAFIRHAALADEPSARTQASRLRRRAGGAPTARIYRLEDRASWPDRLARDLGITLDLPHANRSATGLVRAAEVSAEDRDQIARQFREDYELFGY